MDGLKVSRCPSCHGPDFQPIGRVAPGFEDVVGGRDFVHPPYAVNRCLTCGLYFKSVTLSPAALDAYYAVLDSEIFDIDEDFPTDRILHRRLRRLPPGSCVLDFGCSTGRIVKSLTSQLRTFGVEPNVTAAATARARGIEIVTAEAVAAGDRRYDAILLTDVFEHLADPLPFVQMLAGRLAPRGWLAIVTGNADAAGNRDRISEFWYFRIAGHLIMLGEQHLEWLARQLGLTAEVYRCSHYNIPWRDRTRQWLRSFAYDAFQSAPGGPVARTLRFVPRLSGAERWTIAPTVNYRRDHIVAFFSRPDGQVRE